MDYKTEPLSSSHDKSSFSSGIDALDNYLKKQANQDQKRRLAVCFVYQKEGCVLCYYTLSSNSLRKASFPKSISKKWPPSYENIPTTLIGRFAVDARLQGQGIGKILLVDALRRSYQISKSVGSAAVCVDPKNESAKQFYKKLGFITLPSSGKMILPMKVIASVIK